MEFTAHYPGSIGEIVQGNYKGKDILLSFPINLYTEVRIVERIFPERKYKNPKAAAFMNSLLHRWNFANYYYNLDIEINSKIPRGKGFASSTADLCALYYALLKLFRKEFNQRELIDECIRIEPTDSIIFNRATLFEYKNGKYYETVGDYLEFYILVFEGSRVIDTLEFNNRILPMLAHIDDLIPELIRGIRGKSVEKIAQVATESIMRNRHRLKYEYFEDIMTISDKSGGLGIVGAHSGDCLGIIYDDLERLKYVKKLYNSSNKYKIGSFSTIGIVNESII